MFAGRHPGTADVGGADCRLCEYSLYVAVDAFGTHDSCKFELQLDSELESEFKSKQKFKPKPEPEPEPGSGSEPKSKLRFDIRRLAIEQF